MYRGTSEQVKSLLAGPSPISPMKAEITISPISNRISVFLTHQTVQIASSFVVIVFMTLLNDLFINISLTCRDIHLDRVVKEHTSCADHARLIEIC